MPIAFAMPLSMVIFSLLAEPTNAQENMPENLRYLNALVDTINTKPIKTYYMNMLVETPQDSLDIERMFNNIETLDPGTRRSTTKIMKIIYEDDGNDYGKCIMLALVLDPEGKTILGRDAQERVRKDKLLQITVKRRYEIISNII